MNWIVTTVDGKIASVAGDYRHFASIAKTIASGAPSAVSSVSTRKISTEELLDLAKSVSWEDLRLFGTDFQKKVWKALFGLTHSSEPPKLLSYTDFAALCGNPQGVRSVAHAVAINPIAVIIPCHLIVPKEATDRAAAIRTTARETTLFKGADLYLLDTVDVGDYAWGPDIKREMIKHSLSLCTTC